MFGVAFGKAKILLSIPVSRFLGFLLLALDNKLLISKCCKGEDESPQQSISRLFGLSESRILEEVNCGNMLYTINSNRIDPLPIFTCIRLWKSQTTFHILQNRIFKKARVSHLQETSSSLHLLHYYLRFIQLFTRHRSFFENVLQHLLCNELTPQRANVSARTSKTPEKL